MVSYTQQNLDAALTTASAGLHVFPARVYLNNKSGKWDKVPIIKGWQQGSTDCEQIKAQWKEFPHALPGIALGRAGLLAIDPDRHGGPDGVAAWAKLVAEHGGLPQHPITITPSGGEHHLFRQPPHVALGNGEGRLPSGINVRGRGGFIFAQGATRVDGRGWQPASNSMSLAVAFKTGAISVIPDWLIEILRSRRATASATPGATPATIISIGRPPSGRETAYGASTINGIIGTLAATKHDRNNALNAAAFRLAQLAARGWINPNMAITRLRYACRENGLLQDEPHKIEGTMNSGWRAGLEHPHPDLTDRPYQKRRA